MQNLEAEIRRLIVESLLLEDVTPEQIDRDMPLFGEGLGLDSIDALELGMAIQKKYGIEIKADDERSQQVFRSVRGLAEFIGKHLETKRQET
jgi:acyl carrier protein